MTTPKELTAPKCSGVGCTTLVGFSEEVLMFGCPSAHVLCTSCLTKWLSDAKTRDAVFATLVSGLRCPCCITVPPTANSSGHYETVIFCQNKKKGHHLNPTFYQCPWRYAKEIPAILT